MSYRFSKASGFEIICKRVLFLIILVFSLSLTTSVLSKEANPYSGGFTPEKIFAKPGETISLVLKIKVTADFKTSELRLIYSSALELVSGEPTLILKDFKAGKERLIKYEIKIMKKGTHELMAKITAKDEEHDTYNSQVFIVLINPKEEKPKHETITRDDGTKLKVINVPAKKNK